MSNIVCESALCHSLPTQTIAGLSLGQSAESYSSGEQSDGGMGERQNAMYLPQGTMYNHPRVCPDWHRSSKAPRCRAARMTALLNSIITDCTTVWGQTYNTASEPILLAVVELLRKVVHAEIKFVNHGISTQSILPSGVAEQLLLIAGVEPNPGPKSERGNAMVFEARGRSSKGKKATFKLRVSPRRTTQIKANTLCLSLLDAAFARLTRQGVEKNPGPPKNGNGNGKKKARVRANSASGRRANSIPRSVIKMLTTPRIPPSRKTPRGTVRAPPMQDEWKGVRRRERVASVLTQAVFTTTTYKFNPSNSSIFPWFGSIGRKFERFRVKKLKFEYVPLSSVIPASGSGVSVGEIGLAVQYDVLDENISDFTEFTQYSGARVCVPYAPLELVVDVKRVHQTQESYYTTDGQEYEGRATQLYYPLQLIVAVDAIVGQAGQKLGELWVEAEFDMLDPKPNRAGSEALMCWQQEDPNQSSLVAATGPTFNSALFGLFPSIEFGALVSSVKYDTPNDFWVFTVPKGTYKLDFYALLVAFNQSTGAAMQFKIYTGSVNSWATFVDHSSSSFRASGIGNVQGDRALTYSKVVIAKNAWSFGIRADAMSWSSGSADLVLTQISNPSPSDPYVGAEIVIGAVESTFLPPVLPPPPPVAFERCTMSLTSDSFDPAITSFASMTFTENQVGCFTIGAPGQGFRDILINHPGKYVVNVAYGPGFNGDFNSLDAAGWSAACGLNVNYKQSTGNSVTLYADVTPADDGFTLPNTGWGVPTSTLNVSICRVDNI